MKINLNQVMISKLFSVHIVQCSYCLHLQWAENFICDEVAGEELWEEVVAAARMLANSTETEVMAEPNTF